MPSIITINIIHMNQQPKASFVQVLEIINSQLKDYFQEYYYLRNKKKDTPSSFLVNKINYYLQNNFEKNTESYQDAINTCILLACKYDVIGVVLQMIKLGANINYQNYNAYSPIHLACFSGNYRVLKVLIENKANPFLIDNEGFTPKELIPYRKKMLVDKHGHKANLTGFHICEKIIREAEKNYFEMLQQHHQDDNLIDSIMKNKNQVMQFRSAINKLSPTNVVCIIKLISQIKPETIEQYEEMIEIFYQRCLLDKKFTALYAVLVKIISQTWKPNIEAKKTNLTFQHKLSSLLKNKGLEIENITFAGYLSVLKQVPWSLILNKLLLNYKKLNKYYDSGDNEKMETKMEESSQLIRYIGRNLSYKNPDVLNKIMIQFSKIIKKYSIGKRIQFMITELQELQSDNWKFPDNDLFSLDKKMRKTNWDEIISHKIEPPKTLATHKTSFSKYYNSRLFQAEREYLLEQSVCHYTYSSLISNGYFISNHHKSLSDESKDEIKEMISEIKTESTADYMIIEMLQYHIDDNKITITELIKYLIQIWEELNISNELMISILSKLTPSFPEKIYSRLLHNSPPFISNTHLENISKLIKNKITNTIIIPQICHYGIKCVDSNKKHFKNFIHYKI